MGDSQTQNEDNNEPAPCTVGGGPVVATVIRDGQLSQTLPALPSKGVELLRVDGSLNSCDWTKLSCGEEIRFSTGYLTCLEGQYPLLTGCIEHSRYQARASQTLKSP